MQHVIIPSQADFSCARSCRDLPAPKELVGVASVGTVLGLYSSAYVPVHPGSVITLKDAGGVSVSDGAW